MTTPYRPRRTPSHVPSPEAQALAAGASQTLRRTIALLLVELDALERPHVPRLEPGDLLVVRATQGSLPDRPVVSIKLEPSDFSGVDA